MATVVLGLPTAALAGTFTGTSSGPIAVSKTIGNASPYPSTINVPNAGVVQNVRVTLNNASQLDQPDSIDIALTHGATTVMIVSDAGDTAPADAVSSIYDKNGTDVSASACDTSGQAQWPSGATAHKPVNCVANTGDFNCPDEASADTFPAPGPGVVPAGAGNLGAFDGAQQQGDWSLWIVTDCNHAVPPSSNSFASWTLTITNANPTAVRLADFSAKRAARSVTVRWRTADETDIAGYNVWRVTAGKSAKVNRSLVAARSAGRVGGAGYRLVDRYAAARPAAYRLQVVTVSGKRYWLATTTLAARA